MPTLTDITGLAGIAFALAAAVLAVPGVRRLSRPWLAGVFAGALVFFLVPLGTLPLAGVVRGAVGDLSVTTLVLLGGAVRRSLVGGSLADGRERCAVLGMIAVAALGLYPMALGVGLFDPYRLGYGAPWFLAALGVMALMAWFSRQEAIAAGLALATLAWSVGWYESTNLWDYLLDPLVSLYALGVLLIRGAKRLPGFFRGAQP